VTKKIFHKSIRPTPNYVLETDITGGGLGAGKEGEKRGSSGGSIREPGKSHLCHPLKTNGDRRCAGGGGLGVNFLWAKKRRKHVAKGPGGGRINATGRLGMEKNTQFHVLGSK